jgi:type IV pilus assembly protein PilW
MKNHLSSMVSKRGYTILELLVAIAISAIFMGAIYSAYISQQRSTLGHEQVSAMQRNLRSALYYMEKEIRMAGCDPTGRTNAVIIQANASLMEFTGDINADGTIGTDEQITYSILNNNLVRNGIIIGENIDVLNFVYLDGASPEPNALNPGITNVSASSIPDIRSVQVTVLARTGKEDRHYTYSTPSYKNKQDEDIFIPTGDDVHFRRKLLKTNIKCRNLGL